MKTNKKALLALALVSVLALQPTSMVAKWTWKDTVAVAGIAVGLAALGYQYYYDYNCLNEESTADDVFNNLQNYNLNGIFTVSPDKVRQALLKDYCRLGRNAKEMLDLNTARYDRARIGSKDILVLYKNHKIDLPW